MLKTRSRAGLTDGNVASESITLRLFNALFQWDLKSLNTRQANFPAADLGDFHRRIAVQVTNQSSSGKIRDTQDAAHRHNIGKDFDRIIVFFLLPTKPKFPDEFRQLTRGPKIEAWDIADVLKQASALNNLSALDGAAEVLDEELDGAVRRLRGELELKSDLPGASSSEFSVGRKVSKRPELYARFQERHGTLCLASKRKPKHHPPAYWIDLWVDDAPSKTKKIKFEILDEGFRHNPWKVSRAKKRDDSPREFLTDDMNSWGDVAILMQGRTKGGVPIWFGESTLVQALKRFYTKRPKDPKIRRVLKQFLEN